MSNSQYTAESEHTTSTPAPVHIYEEPDLVNMDWELTDIQSLDCVMTHESQVQLAQDTFVTTKDE